MFNPAIAAKFNQYKIRQDVHSDQSEPTEIYICCHIGLNGGGGVLASKTPDQDLKILEIHRPLILSDDSITSMLSELHKSIQILERDFSLTGYYERGRLYINPVSPLLLKDIKNFIFNNISDHLPVVMLDDENDYLGFKMLCAGGKIELPEQHSSSLKSDSILNRINSIDGTSIVDADIEAIAMAAKIWRKSGRHSGFAGMKL